MNEAMKQTEAAAFLCCDEATLERRVLAGEIVYVDLDGQILYLREDLMDYLRSRRKRGGVAVEECRQVGNPSLPFMASLDVMTEREAAAFIRKSSSTLKKMRLDGDVPHLPGKPVTYLRTGLLAHLQSIEIPPCARLTPSEDSSADVDDSALRSAPLSRSPRSTTASYRNVYREALDL